MSFSIQNDSTVALGVIDHMKPSGWGAISSALTAYGCAVGQSATTVAGGAAVVFDLGATPYPNAGFSSVPAPGGTTFTVGSSGVYEFDFHVAGTDGAGTTQSLQFGVWRNGALPSGLGGAQAYIFQSGIGAATGATMICSGKGLIQLTAADTITLVNMTNGSATTVTFASPQTGVTVAGATRSLMLKRIA